jgi:hypothetical protein
MATLNVTIPTGKAGRVSVFTIEFKKSDFEKVIDSVSEIQNEKELRASNLWTVK